MKITYFTKDDMIIVEDEVEEIIIEHDNGVRGVTDESNFYHVVDNK